METDSYLKSIAILGGTGKEGKGLAYRWAKAGYTIIIGSRDEQKAIAAAKEIELKLEGTLHHRIEGMENARAAEIGETVVLTVPYAVHVPMVESVKDKVKGKLFIDVTVPLVPPKVTKVQLPPQGSVAMETKGILGDDVQIVTAFQNISYENLWNDKEVDCDVLVCGTSKSAREMVIELVKATGLRGWDAGPLENSVVAEGLTSILIGINKQYSVSGTGIRITGVPRD